MHDDKEKSAEPEHFERFGTSVPFVADGIGTRISAAAKIIGPRKAAALAAGVSTDSLQRYIREEVKPSFDAMYGLALIAGVRLEWLATGDGPMRVTSDLRSPSGVNISLLSRAIEAIEDGLAPADKMMPSDKKAALIVAVYNLFVDSNGDLNKEDVLSFVGSEEWREYVWTMRRISAHLSE